jgi:hypothetical protein
MEYQLMEREFDRVLKRAMPYLILSPGNVRVTVADYMKSMWLAMRNNNQMDFDLCCMNVNEAIANSEGCTDSFLQCNISDFNERWSGLDESISKLRKELIELRLEVKNIKKEPNLVKEGEKIGKTRKIQVSVKEEVPIEEKVPIEAPAKVMQENYITIGAPKIIDYLKSNKEITNPIVRDLCGVGMHQAKYLLQTLVKKNSIQKFGISSHTKYVLKE